ADECHVGLGSRGLVCRPCKAGAAAPEPRVLGNVPDLVGVPISVSPISGDPESRVVSQREIETHAPPGNGRDWIGNDEVAAGNVHPFDVCSYAGGERQVTAAVLVCDTDWRFIL